MVGGIDEVLRAAEQMDRDVLLERLREVLTELGRLRAENDRLKADNDALKKELERLLRQQRGHGQRKKRRAQARAPATGAGPRRGRSAPPLRPDEPCTDVSVEPCTCPHCGGELEDDGWEHVSTTDIPKVPEPEVAHFRMQTKKCKRCGRKVRAQHPDVPADQHGATAHRVGERTKAAAHSLHYGVGIPQRKVPFVLQELCNIRVTQGALSQDAGRRARDLQPQYSRLRDTIRLAAIVHTDDTGWRVAGQSAQLMVFTTEQGDTLYQIRSRHRNEEVREVLPSDWQGTMVTDRGRSYDAWQLAGVKQSKCSFHVLRSIEQVLDTKQGAARWFGLELKELTQASVALRNAWRDNTVDDSTYRLQANELQAKIDWHLRDRKLTDADNERLRRELAKHNGRGNLFRYLQDPSLPTTNNLAEREVRPGVVARKVSGCSKTWAGAHTREVMQSIVRSEVRKKPASLVEAMREKFVDATDRLKRTLHLDSTPS